MRRYVRLLIMKESCSNQGYIKGVIDVMECHDCVTFNVGLICIIAVDCD